MFLTKTQFWEGESINKLIKIIQKDQKTKKALLLFLILIIISFIIWNSHIYSTVTTVDVKEVRNEEIVVKDDTRGKITVRVPPETSALIEEGSKYRITYERRKWEQPRLTSIRPWD